LDAHESQAGPKCRPPFSSGHLLRKNISIKRKKENIFISVRMGLGGKKKVTTFGRPKDKQKVNTKPSRPSNVCIKY
jgi:hypothetical protein